MKNFDRIQRYLKKEMSESDSKKFESDINTSKELAIEVELQRQENKVLRNLAQEQLKNKIIKLDQNNATVNSINRSGPKIVSMQKNKVWRPLLIAATLAFLVFFGYQFFNQPSSITETVAENPIPTEKEEPIIIEKNEPIETVPKQEIAVKEPKVSSPKKEQPSPSTPENKIQIEPFEQASATDFGLLAMNSMANEKSILRGEEVEKISDSQWKKIVSLYNDEKYREVITIVNQLPAEHMYYIDAKQKKAEAQLKSSQFSQATQSYQELLSDGDEFLIDTYQYGLLISLLAQLPSSTPSFKKLLSEIDANPDFTFQKEIQQVKIRLQKANFNFE